jgi:hypothetical protein
MYASVTRVKVKDFNNIKNAAASKTAPDVTSIPGFVAYYVIPGKKHFTTVAIFKDSSGIDNWHNLCREQYRDLKHHFDGPEAVEVAAGHVLYARTAAKR